MDGTGINVRCAQPATIPTLKQPNGGEIKEIARFYENLSEHQSTYGQSPLTNEKHQNNSDELKLSQEMAMRTSPLVGGNFGPEGGRANGREVEGYKNSQE